MTENRNPYAPPAETAQASANSWPEMAPDGGVWRLWSEVVVARHTSLPPRCVKCNAPVEGELREQKVHWHEPLLFILLLFSPLVYVVIALLLRKKASVRAGLCESHQKKRRNAIIIGWSGFILSIILLGLGFATGQEILFILCILIFLVSLLFGTAATRVVYATKIDSYFVRLKGAGFEFLNSLPPYPYDPRR